MDIDVDTRSRYMSDAPILDPQTGYALNYPIGLQIGPGPERDALAPIILAKRAALDITVEDDLLDDEVDPDAERDTFDLFFEDEDED